MPILTRVPPTPSDYDVECGTYGLVVVNAAEEEDEAASETSSSLATGSDGTWKHSMTGDYRTHPFILNVHMPSFVKLANPN